MATVQQQEFDMSDALLGLYEGLPYVRKLGYNIGEMAGHILLRVIIDYSKDDSDDESHANFSDGCPEGGRA